MRRFTFLIYGTVHEGVRFHDGLVVIRALHPLRKWESYEFKSVDEMLAELCLSPLALCWIDRVYEDPDRFSDEDYDRFLAELHAVQPWMHERERPMRGGEPA